MRVFCASKTLEYVQYGANGLDASGGILLNNFGLSQNGRYQLNFDSTGNDRMNYHRGLPLSTIDRDNANWLIIARTMQRHSVGIIHVVTSV